MTACHYAEIADEREIEERLNIIKEIGRGTNFYCEKCNNMISPSRESKVSLIMPETLLVYVGESEKSRNFRFPLKLNLGEQIYLLKAVHNGLIRHATASVNYGKKWYYVNDEYVDEIGSPYNKYAVLLFYQKY